MQMGQRFLTVTWKVWRAG